MAAVIPSYCDFRLCVEVHPSAVLCRRSLPRLFGKLRPSRKVRGLYSEDGWVEELRHSHGAGSFSLAVVSYTNVTEEWAKGGTEKTQISVLVRLV